ncbi:MAG: hypothetical protein R3E79_56235 [Caldilineaceae bacterium]
MKSRIKQTTNVYGVLLVLGIVILTGAYTMRTSIASALPQSAYQQLQAAWQRAGAIGQYDYHSTILQTSTPATTLSNAGRSPQTQRIRIDGSLDKAADATQMQLQIGQRPPIAIKIEAGQAYGRQSNGDEWTKLEQMPDLFAPDGDPLGFLVAMEKVREIGPNERGMDDISAPAELVATRYAGNESLTRYAFDLSGPKFAGYVKTQMEAELRRKGELPLQANLSSAGQYVAMTGHGELWIGARVARASARAGGTAPNRVAPARSRLISAPHFQGGLRRQRWLVALLARPDPALQPTHRSHRHLRSNGATSRHDPGHDALGIGLGCAGVDPSSP